MKKRIMLPLVLLALLVLIGVVGVATRPAPRTLKVELSGTPGLSVTGAYAADGNSYGFAGVLPTNFSARARAFTYTITNQTQGVLMGQLYIDGVESGLSRSTGTNTG